MHVKKSIFIFIIIIFFWGVLLAQGMEKTIFQGYEGCFVMDQLASGKKESMNLKRCGMPEVPC